MGKEFAGIVVARGAGAKFFVEGDRVFCRAFVYLEKGHAKGKVVVRMVNE